jgi:hypothetical protein
LGCAQHSSSSQASVCGRSTSCFRLAAPRTDKPVTEITTAGRTGLRQGTVSELTVDGKNEAITGENRLALFPLNARKRCRR